MFCSNCGGKTSEGAQFCANCGKPIDNVSKESVIIQQPITDKNLWEYFIGCFKKYAVFQGRARRKEYWGFFLFYFIFGIIASILDMMIFGSQFSDYGVIYIIWTLATIIPNLSVCVRRYHDCNKSGWVILIPIYNIILDFIEGTHGANRFGDDPKGEKVL